jgi:hypothetical protein
VNNWTGNDGLTPEAEEAMKASKEANKAVDKDYGFIETRHATI